MASAAQKQATLYRMVQDKHLCPYGLKAKHLLQSKGFKVTEKHLKTRDEIDAFKTELGVKTTPQIFINEQRVGGFEDLKRYFGIAIPDPNRKTYAPVIALFSVALAIAIATTWLVMRQPLAWQTLGWFLSSSMILLGLQKLKDLESFATMFLNYDLLAQRWVPYGYIYPFAETGAGLLMFAGVLTFVSAPVALFIAGIGAYSVFKAVYIDKRELKCACVGGSSNVPLGFVSLLENLMMVGMAVWMLAMVL